MLGVDGERLGFVGVDLEDSIPGPSKSCVVFSGMSNSREDMLSYRYLELIDIQVCQRGFSGCIEDVFGYVLDIPWVGIELFPLSSIFTFRST